MPRYKKQIDINKNGVWRQLSVWARIVIVAVSLIVMVFVATVVTKRLVSKVPPVYGGTIEDAVLSKRALISKINALQNTLVGYDAELTTLQQLQSENDALKAELGRTPKPTGVLAHVLTLPNRSFYDTMLIDGGSAEGVKQNMVAYAFGSVAVGTVSSVDAHSATVQLYSAPGRQTSGTAVGGDVAVTLIGRGSGEYEVQLPRDVPFSIGATIAMQSTTPATMATVEKVITDPRDPFQRLLAKVPVNLQALKWVIVR